MNRVRGHTQSRSGEMDSAVELRLNRLSRKYRQSQTAAAAGTGSPRNQDSDFKTPTRTFVSRTAAGFSAESPHNDSDVQQDIIWDATSPSPNRLRGKRGRNQATGFVNISEIVNRIAPKHGRPQVMEPTLQQWIGDSATIPCTPDVHVPKPKKKSPRATGVDDLLKLAKQFDFTMFHQDEDEEDVHQQSLELLSEDVFSVDAVCETDTRRLHLDQHIDDDFDRLFDEATQSVSGNLSPPLSAQGSQVKAAPALAASAAPSAGDFTKGSTDVFVDDWENDELLNDSLVLDMTQNPHKFSAPKYSSTQRLSSDTPARGGTVLTQSAISNVEKKNMRQRASFRLESSPHLAERKTHCSAKAAGGDTEQAGVLYDAGSKRHQQTSNAEKSKVSKTSVSDAQDLDKDLDKDLDVFFSSEPVWDDPDDDELLCEVCEDVENQIQKNKPAEQRTALQAANQQPLPHKDTPTHLLAALVTDSFTNTQTESLRRGGRATSAAVAPPPAPLRNNSKEQFTFKKPSNQNHVTKTGLDSSNNTQTEGLWRGGGVTSAAAAAPPPAPLRNNNKEQFTFKKPSNKVVGKCSAVEIELKKQQAMERRRLRLQATAHKVT